MVYIPKRSVCRVDLKQLNLRYFVSENHAEQRVSAFVQRRTDCARDITRRSAVIPEVCIESFIAKRD